MPQTYGTVEYWKLVTRFNSGETRTDRFRSWEAVTDAYREAVKEQPLSATVYAVQLRGMGEIKTWDYTAPNTRLKVTTHGPGATPSLAQGGGRA